MHNRENQPGLQAHQSTQTSVNPKALDLEMTAFGDDKQKFLRPLHYISGSEALREARDRRIAKEMSVDWSYLKQTSALTAHVW